MKINSAGAARPSFNPIAITITVESLEEMKALKRLCEAAQGMSEPTQVAFGKLVAELLPHVTPL
jgi:hypothetical protein